MRAQLVRRVAVVVALLALLVPATALATDIYVNGVRLTFLAGVTLPNATVRFDERGNVHITAPGYRLVEQRHDGTERTLGDAGTSTSTPTSPPSPPEARPSPDTRPIPAAITRRYFVVAETNAPGQVQYNVDVMINGTLFRTYRDTPARVIDDITSRLRPGPNEVHMIARRVGRRSSAATDYLRLTVGEGRAEGTTAVIDTTLVRFQRGANEVRTVEQTFSVFAR